MEIFNLIIYFLIAIITGVLYFVKSRYSYWKNRSVPFVEPNFIYGNIKNVGKTIHPTEFFCNMYEKFKGKYPFVGAYFFIKPVVIVTDLDLVKNVLIKDFNFFTDRGTFYNEKDDPLSAHLFNLVGQRWKNLRAKLSPTFTSGKIKFMFSTVVDVAKELDKTLSIITSNESDIEVRDICGRFTTDVIGSCAFGIECNSLKDPQTEFRVLSSLVFEKPRHSGTVKALIRAFPQLARYLRIKSVPEKSNDFFLRIVRETVEYREKNNVHRKDFMNLLIELKNNEKVEDSNNGNTGKLSLEEITALAFAFFLAGYETSSSVMSFALYELSLNLDIQEKVRTEIFEVLEKHKELNYEAMLEMKFLNQIINETLRMFPPVATLHRVANKPYNLPNDSEIPEGTKVIIPVYAIHHDAENYPEPEKFDPERFTEENKKTRHPYSFIPFGDGPRNCIGLRFGLMQTKVGLASILRNFRIEVCDKTEIPIQGDMEPLTWKPAGQVWLKFVKIEK